MSYKKALHAKSLTLTLPLLSTLILTIAFTACHKSNSAAGTTDFKTLEQQVINDFANKTALPQYDSLLNVATALNSAITNLSAGVTDGNLQIAQAAWKRIRTVWEQCEGFPIGPPQESSDYDP